MKEHPVMQAIEAVIVSVDGNGDTRDAFYVTGDVTRIEACEKSGMHANIPYLRVWKGDVCVAEMCQHNVLIVYYKEPTP